MNGHMMCKSCDTCEHKDILQHKVGEPTNYCKLHRMDITYMLYCNYHIEKDKNINYQTFSLPVIPLRTKLFVLIDNIRDRQLDKYKVFGSDYYGIVELTYYGFWLWSNDHTGMIFKETGFDFGVDINELDKSVFQSLSKARRQYYINVVDRSVS